MSRSSLFVVCFYLLLGPGLASSENTSPVQKVIELLDELKAKVEGDLKAEADAMDKNSDYCKDTAEEKAYAIKTSKTLIANIEASALDAQANIEARSTEVAELSSSIAEKESELAGKDQLREKEHETFLAKEKEMIDTIDELSRGVVQVKKGASFLQEDGAADAGEKQKVAIGALKKLVEAAWLDKADKSSLKSFLQQSQAEKAQAAAGVEEGEEDELSLRQPQGSVSAFDSHSGGIVETLEDMQLKAENTLSDLRKEDLNAGFNFKMVEQGLKNEMKTAKAMKAAATASKAENGEALGKAKGEKAETEQTLAADKEFLVSLQQDCEQQAKEWAQRQESADGEMAALAKAREILVSGVKALVQMSTQTRRMRQGDSETEEEADDEKREALAAALRKAGRKVNSYALSQLGQMALNDPFEKIRGLINDMVEKLMNEAAAEADQKSFCDEEMAKSRKSQAEKSMKLDGITARVDSAATKSATLKENIKGIQGDIAEIDRLQAEATKLRTEEHEEYLKASKDYKDSADAVVAAIGVLKSYYEGAFLQVSTGTVSAAAAKSKAKAQAAFGLKLKVRDANTIIGMLEVAASDFTKMIAETETEETAAAQAFVQLSKESTVSKARKDAEAKGMASEVKSLQVALGHHTEDQKAVGLELDAVLAYLDKLKPQCEQKAMSYEEKKARREAEIEGLKEAIAIISGKSVAVSLVQRGHLRSGKKGVRRH